MMQTVWCLVVLSLMCIVHGASTGWSDIEVVPAILVFEDHIPPLMSQGRGLQGSQVPAIKNIQEPPQVSDSGPQVTLPNMNMVPMVPPVLFAAFDKVPRRNPGNQINFG